MRKIAIFFIGAFSTLSFAKERTTTFRGTFTPFAEAAGSDMGITGQVKMKKNQLGAKFEIQFKNLDPKEMYVSHVHAEPCTVNQAGGHYKFNPAIATSKEENEIWFDIPSHKKSAKIEKRVSDSVRPDARSVVIHRMKGEAMLKVGCADLVTK